MITWGLEGILKKAILSLIILVFLAILPLLGLPIYYISFFFTVFLYVVLASSWNIIGGYTGYLSFGHVAFLGIGAFTSAVVMRDLHLSPVGVLFSSILAGIISSLVAVLFGYPSLKLRGPYFAVITLCFVIVVSLVIRNLHFFGGPDGLWLKAMDLPIRVIRSIFFEVMLLIMVLSLLLGLWVKQSRFGAGLRAIREDEEVAQTMGVNAAKLKIIAFGLSAFFPGMAGGVYAYHLTYIHSYIVFDVSVSILVVLMTVFGGGGTWFGPIIGAISLTVVNEILSTFLRAEFARIIYGALFVGVVIFMPNGIMAFWNRSRAKSNLKPFAYKV
jgi:branched-chain amino acid transport system permease protein